MRLNPLRVLGFIALVWLAAMSPVKANYDSANAWFGTLTEEDRFALQIRLVLLGYYDGFVDGVFGRGTYSAISKYESSLGQNADGELTAYERSELEGRAAERASAYGLDFIEDTSCECKIAVPRTLDISPTSTENGTIYKSPDGSFAASTSKDPAGAEDFSASYEQARSSADAGSGIYARRGEDWWVVSGTVQGMSFYAMGVHKNGYLRRVLYLWAPKQAEVGRRLALLSASYLMTTKYPNTGAPQTAAVPAPQSPPPPPAPTSDESTPGERIGSFILLDATPGAIVLQGEISPGTPLELLRALKARPAKVLILDSPGGNVNAALLVAHEVRERGIMTYVPAGMGCYSACAYVFFAGVSRLAQGDLGVHQVYGDSVNLEEGQMALSDVMEALSDFDVNPGVFPIMLRTPPTEMHVFTEAEMASLQINNSTPDELLTTITGQDLDASIEATTDQEEPDLLTSLGNYAEKQRAAAKSQ